MVGRSIDTFAGLAAREYARRAHKELIRVSPVYDRDEVDPDDRFIKSGKLSSCLLTTRGAYLRSV